MNENQRQDPIDAICGARNRAGALCGNRPRPNGRCRFHGGMSTGPRTAEGLERLRDARTVHGAYRSEALEMRRLFSSLKKQSRTIIERVE
jgi:hypothetical protein